MQTTRPRLARRFRQFAGLLDGGSNLTSLAIEDCTELQALPENMLDAAPKLKTLSLKNNAIRGALSRGDFGEREDYNAAGAGLGVRFSASDSKVHLGGSSPAWAVKGHGVRISNAQNAANNGDFEIASVTTAQ